MTASPGRSHFCRTSCAFLRSVARNAAAQSFMAAAYEADGYAVDMWRVDVDAIGEPAGLFTVAVSYDDGV